MTAACLCAVSGGVGGEGRDIMGESGDGRERMGEERENGRRWMREGGREGERERERERERGESKLLVRPEVTHFSILLLNAS